MIKRSISKLKKFRVNPNELNTEIKLSICSRIMSHKNVQHTINKKTYRILEEKIHNFVSFVENSHNHKQLDESFKIWSRQEDSNFAFIKLKNIIQMRAKEKLSERKPANIDQGF